MNNSHESSGVSPDATCEDDAAVCDCAFHANARRAAESQLGKWGDDQERKLPALPAYVGQHRAQGNAYPALDYRKRSGGRWQRCSRCHRETELGGPVIYQLNGRIERTGQGQPETGLIPITVGNDLLGFSCSDCFMAVCQHVASVFPDAMGFPHVDADGMLVPTPRCECGAPLQYASDGRMVCSHAGMETVTGCSRRRPDNG